MDRSAKEVPCPHTTIASSLDRWTECHWHLHQMESNYHVPDPFRYSLNSFIRSAKEVPGILMSDLQRHPKVRAEVDSELKKLSKNPLFATLKKRRDFLVHRGMLAPKSHGRIGTTEGSRVKITFPFHVVAHETSEEAYERYKAVCRNDRFLRQLTGPDCDSAPTLWRTWQIEDFPDQDLLEVAFDSWQLLGKILSATTVALGSTPLDLTMSCRHDPKAIQLKKFSQRDFFLSVDGIDLAEDARQGAEKRRRHKDVGN